MYRVCAEHCSRHCTVEKRTSNSAHAVGLHCSARDGECANQYVSDFPDKGKQVKKLLG